MYFKMTANLFIGKTRPDYKKTPAFKPRPLARWRIDTNDSELNIYGSLWGESLVLQLGNHLSIYRQPESLWWALNQTISPIHPAYKPQHLKVAGTSIAGNFGEVFTILALESQISYPNFLNVCHITSVSNSSSPDLFLETEPFVQVYNQKFNKRKIRPELVPFIAGECKNSDFSKAFRQLAAYWSSYPSSGDFGYGLISTIDYKQPNELIVNFNLIIPRDESKVKSILASKDKKQLRLNSIKVKEAFYGFG
ncbi:hypothetical protein [Bacillus thuringiensis]|uniref:hypothetical protein n=1 Tax=Bacillus thuringiensis TaxID=1428 RepID=UPI000BF76FBE|nr:hypothetical protein [Bacillus thuringiensis]PFE93428.1 hypothetical protein CN321_11600 [Bacillus thuringiensis]PFV41113.1 hypothetical protein COL03_18905 [Bacillus thuringiensis]